MSMSGGTSPEDKQMDGWNILDLIRDAIHGWKNFNPKWAKLRSKINLLSDLTRNRSQWKQYPVIMAQIIKDKYHSDNNLKQTQTCLKLESLKSVKIVDAYLTKVHDVLSMVRN